MFYQFYAELDTNITHSLLNYAQIELAIHFEAIVILRFQELSFLIAFYLTEN